MSDEDFKKSLKKCQEMLSAGQRANWGCQWYKVFEPVLAHLVGLLLKDTPGIEKKVKQSAKLLRLASSKIVPNKPSPCLLEWLNRIVWQYDELAGMERDLGLVSDAEARAGAAEPEIRWDDEKIEDSSEEVKVPAYTDQRRSESTDFVGPIHAALGVMHKRIDHLEAMIIQIQSQLELPASAGLRVSGLNASSNASSNSTATSTPKRKRAAADVPLEGSLTAKIARPSELSRTPRHVASLGRSKLVSSPSHADDFNRLSASYTPLASEEAENLMP